MSIRLSKLIHFAQCSLLCLLVSACGEGKRDFVPFDSGAAEPSEEIIFVDAAAVKGPLANTEMYFYQVNIDEGKFKQHRDAAIGFFKLLDKLGIEYIDQSVVFTGDQATLLANIKSELLSYGFTTNFPSLAERIDQADSLSAALTLLTDYLSETGETNASYKDLVLDIEDSYASLADLKRKIEAIESIGDQVNTSSGFSNLLSLSNRYRKTERSSIKLPGWDDFLAEVRDLSGRQTSRAELIADLQTFQDTAEANLQLNEDRVAIRRLDDLIKDVKATGSIRIAEELITQAHREEGNIAFKSTYKGLINNTISVDDAIDRFLSKEALYNLAGLNDLLEQNIDLSEFVAGVVSLLETQLREGFSEALVDPRKDSEGVPLNRIQRVGTKGTSLALGVELGEVKGLVYVEAKSGSQTVDLNTGQVPVIQQMEGIFHTDSIRGYGDNNKEDSIVLYTLDGIVQRDEEGDPITRPEGLDGPESDYQRIYPSRIVSPLSSLALDYMLEKFASFDHMNSDADGDGLNDLDLDDQFFKVAMSNVSDLLIDSFGIGQVKSENIFDSPALITEAMKGDIAEQLTAINYRASIENYSSLLVELAEELNSTLSETQQALAEDLLDARVNGRNGNSGVALTESLPYLQYLVQKSPSDRLIAGTAYAVSDVAKVMKSQLSQVAPELEAQDFLPDLSSLDFTNPIGGLDSDDDGFADVVSPTPSGYPGLWSAEVDINKRLIADLEGNVSIDFNIEQGESRCSTLPCVSLGDISTPVLDTWTVVKAPAQGQMTIEEDDDANVIGFSAFANVPGDYLVNGTLLTEAAPEQTLTVTVPIRILDPRAFVFSFNPATPELGEPVNVELLLTKEICESLPADNSDCLGADFDDSIPDYADIAALGDLFRINWQGTGSSNLQKSYISLSEVAGNVSVLNTSNVLYQDGLSAEVVYQGNGSDYVVSDLDTSISLNTSLDGEGQLIGDSDQDGVADYIDAYPFDPNCSLSSEGIADSNGDGQIDSSDSPVCQASVKPASGATVYDFTSKDERWESFSSSNFLFRSRLSDPGVLLQPVSIARVNSPLSVAVDYPLSRNVLLGFQNGEIKRFNFDDMSLHDLTDAATLGLEGSAVTQMQVIDKLLLVEFSGGQSRLLDISGELVELTASRLYPRAGEGISLGIREGNIAIVLGAFDVTWSLERYDPVTTLYSVVNDLAVTEDQVTLLPGQTLKGELVTVNVSLGAEVLMSKTFPVLDLGVFRFENIFYDETDTVRLVSEGADLTGVSGKSLEVDGYQFIVDWLVNGETENYGKRVLRSSIAPFELPSGNKAYGDIVQAKISLLRNNAAAYSIDEVEVILIGSPEDFVASTGIAGAEPNITIQAGPGTTNREFFDKYFIPRWYVDDELVEGQSGLEFPAADSDFVLKYGHSVSLEFSYQNGLVGGESDIQLVTVIGTTGASGEPYQLVPRNLSDADLVTVSFDTFSSNQLEEFTPVWLVNGIVDPLEIGFDYPFSKLSQGDHLQLNIIKGGGGLAGEFAFTADAELIAGYDLSAGSDASPDDDGDGVRNILDYVRNDSACSLERDGNPDDSDEDGLSDQFELNWGVPGQRIYLNVADSDGDGIDDGDEISNGTDPADALDPPFNPDDADRDGLENADELLIGTEVLVADTDGDGLSDGFEFNSSEFDPLDEDSDNDGISDGIEYRQAQGKAKTKVPAGTCYASWLGSKANLLTKTSDAPQTDDTGAQKTAYVYQENGKSEIVVFDHAAMGFDNSVRQSVYEHQIEAIEFRTDDLNYLYAGLDTGQVIELDLSESQQAFDDTAGRVFSTLSDDAITAILDQGSLLIVETLDADTGIYSQHIFDKPGAIGVNLAAHQINSGASIAKSVWRDDSKAQLWYLLDSAESPRLFVADYDGTTPSNSTTAEIDIPAGFQLSAPFYFRNLTDQRLLFSGGFLYDTVGDAWEQGASGFRYALEHQGHRVQVPLRDSRLTIQNFPSNDEESFRQLQSTFEFKPVGIAPIGTDVIVMGEKTVGSEIQLIFERFAVGDTDGDGLPGWWEVFYGGGSGETLVASDLYDGTNSYLDAYQSSLDAVRYLRDQDADGIVDGDEVCADDLCLLLADRDNDFLLDGDEALFGYALDDADSDDNDIIDGNEDFDGDGLSNRLELYTLGTDPTVKDTDLDGLEDAIEVNVLGTNPLLADSDDNTVSDADEDFDGDGLSNLFEIQIGTSPLHSDTDGDLVSDYQEVSYDGNDTDLTLSDLDPLNPDTDGDGISDNIEIQIAELDPLVMDANDDTDSDGLINSIEVLLGSNLGSANSDGDTLTDAQEYELGTSLFSSDSDGDGLDDDVESTYATDPILSDTDQDGLTDGFEVLTFGSSPLLVDTDGDTLSDLTEFEYEFEYSVEELERFNFPPGSPSTLASPTLVDTDGDLLSDADEIAFGSNIAERDSDNDGLSDLDEFNGKTLPRSQDTDQDDILDGDELIIGTKALDKDSDDNGTQDGDEDNDQDGLTNAEELNLLFSDPTEADGTGYLFNDAGNLVKLNGSIYFADAFQRIKDATGVLNGDIVDENDNVLLADGAFVIVGGNGIEDKNEDPDQDGLTNEDELAAGTDPYHWDSDRDGLSDKVEVDAGIDPLEEDSDGDGLSDLFEVTPVALGGSQTNPNEEDTDGDGLNDKLEFDNDLDPNNVDTDGDLIIDGDEADETAARAFDQDGDSIADGLERLFLGTSSNAIDGRDSDEDGIDDNQEVWVYVYDLSGDLVPQFNSRNSEPRWVPEQFSADLVSTNPDTHDIQRVSYANGDLLGDVYIRRISNPTVSDSDQDGLNDDMEILDIEGFREDYVAGPISNLDLDIATGTLYSPSDLNSDIFVLSDPFNSNTNLDTDIATGKTVPDGEEDLDGDRLVNRLDTFIDNNNSTVRNPDSDRSGVNLLPDGLSDGIELLLLGSDPVLEDSDSDGLLDGEEIQNDIQASEREVADGQGCLDTELRLSNIAGRNYCYTVVYSSFPTEEDSDNDQVTDDLDEYPLDVNCNLLSDGFDNAGEKVCFASWLAQQEDIEQIRFISDASPVDQAAVYTAGWDQIVRYDYSEGSTGYLDRVTGVSNMVAIEYSSASSRLYMVDVVGNISFIDPDTYATGDAASPLFNALPASGSVVAMAIAGSDIVLQVERAGETDLYIYDAAGSNGVALSNQSFDVAYSYWNSANSRLYGFVKSSLEQAATDIGYISIVASEFTGGVVSSGFDFAGNDPRGRLALSSSGTELVLAAGYTVDLSLGSVAPFNYDSRVEVYDRFNDVLEVSGHRGLVGQVDPETEKQSNLVRPNAVLVSEVAGMNQYELFPADEDDRILRLLPRSDGDIVYVSVDEQSLQFNVLGLDDVDADGLTRLYENYYALDDNDDSGENGQFGDPDEDFLTNLEEFDNGTDPRNPDTDGDTWEDGTEVFNGFDPLDPTSF